MTNFLIIRQLRSSLLLLLLCIFFNINGYSQSSNPFNLPAGLPVPEWVSATNWNAPNVHQIDSLMSVYKHANGNKRASHENEEENGFREDPYVTAYIRWRDKMAPFIQNDGSIRYDPDYARRQLMKSIEVSNEAVSGKKAEKTTTAANWTLLGPIQSYNDNGSGLANYQSNVYCIAIAPSNPSVLYAATEPGTLYKSTDKGLHWVPVTSGLVSCQASTIAIDPTNANIVYCYDATSNTILKTTDGGITWHVLTSYTYTGGNRMVIAPVSGRLLITGNTAIYYSDDTGATWTLAAGSTGGIYDIALDPTNHDTVYAAGNSAGPNFMLLRSVDGGTNFTNVTGGLTGINTGGARLGVTVANSNYVYCVNIGGTSAPRIIKSTDRGQTWNITVTSNDSTSLTGNNDTTLLGMSNGQGYYDLDIVVNPLNANNVLVGTTSTYKSVDGGFNFRPVGGYNGNFGIHPDLQQAVANGSDCYLSTDGGINHSSDFFTSLTNWTIRNNNIGNSDFWGFGQGWDEDIVVGGRYHNGDGALYENYGTGNGLRLGGGEDATGHVFQGLSRTVGFRDIGTLVLPSSLAAPIQWGAPLVPNSMWPQDDYYGMFSSKLVIDPRYSNVFYLGEDSILWKSTNSGASYSALHNFGNGRKVWRFDIARSNYKVIYACLTNSIYKTTDGGNTWTAISIPGSTYQYYNTDIVVDPLNENNVYFCQAQGSPAQKVYSSTNGGATWTNITGTVLNNQAVAFLQFHGGTNGGVYAVTNSRPSTVYYKDNTMADWTPFSTGLPKGLEAREGGLIFYRDSKMRLCGNNSIWESPLYTTGAPVAQPMANRQYIGCSSDTVNFFDYSMYNYAGATRLWTFPGSSWVSSDTALRPRVTYPSQSSYNVTLKVTNSLGQTNTRTVDSMITFLNDLCGPDTVAGLCAQMNGDNTTINLGNVPVNSNTFSISCWVQPKGNQSSFSQLVSHDVYPGSNGYGFGMGFTFDGYTQNLELCYTDSIVNYYNSSGLICDSTKWNFVVLSYAPTGVTMYLNGIASVVNPGPMPSINLSTSPFYLNFDDNEGQGSRFNGKIDEVKFYNYALSQEEVRTKMHLIQNNPLSETGLLKYFQFNQYDITSGLLHDAAGEYATNVPAVNITRSTAPVATGTVFSNPSVSVAGLNSFPAADFGLYLHGGSTYPNGEVVAFHLRSNPDTTPGGKRIVPGYFVINNFGTDTTFTMPDSILMSNLRIDAPTYTPGNFKLYQRPFGAFGNTWSSELDSASTFSFAINHSSLTYTTNNNITNLSSQLVVVNNNPKNVGVPQPQNQDQWRISELYPNPANEWSRIEIHAPNVQVAEVVFTVYDMDGKQLLRLSQELNKTDNTVMLHFPHWSSGNYLLSVEIGGEVVGVRKFVME